MAIDKGFDDLALDVIIASTWHDNPASARVLTKCGFTHWQTHYQDSVARGVPTLVQQYRLTRIDWQRLRA
jgi:RimJ/RimL family protein N-acetyltransferase